MLMNQILNEASIIKRLGFENDVRLACQLKPTKTLVFYLFLIQKQKRLKRGHQ